MRKEDILKEAAKAGKRALYTTSPGTHLLGEAIRGTGQGIAQAAGQVVSTNIDSKAKKEISKNQITKDYDVERARMEQSKFDTVMRALSSVRSPASLVATVIGLASSPTKYRDLTSQAIDTSKNN